jgi:hypothetical protein
MIDDKHGTLAECKSESRNRMVAYEPTPSSTHRAAVVVTGYAALATGAIAVLIFAGWRAYGDWHAGPMVVLTAAAIVGALTGIGGAIVAACGDPRMGVDVLTTADALGRRWAPARAAEMHSCAVAIAETPEAVEAGH